MFQFLEQEGNDESRDKRVLEWGEEMTMCSFALMSIHLITTTWPPETDKKGQSCNFFFPTRSSSLFISLSALQLTALLDEVYQLQNNDGINKTPMFFKLEGVEPRPWIISIIFTYSNARVCIRHENKWKEKENIHVQYQDVSGKKFMWDESDLYIHGECSRLLPSV